MFEKVSLLLLGFFLTTVGGGLVATLLQHRAWLHKWQVENAEKRIETAKQVFEEVSRLMDKRLFRVDQLLIWIRRGDKDRVELSLQNYREVIFDWNDNINRHLAMLQIYFGNEIREEFDFHVGAKFVRAGSGTEVAYRNFVEGKLVSDDLPAVSTAIEELRSEVYHYNIKLLTRIESQKESRNKSNLLADIKSLF